MITSLVGKKPLHRSRHCLRGSCKTLDAAFTYNPRGELTRATLGASYDNNINQTLVQTSTGIWAVAYNADNRPISFTKTEGDQTTLIECSYDYMGRRSMKKFTLNGTLTLHHRYIYRGYLQIACVDLMRSGHPALWLTMWDPSEPVATRPLAIQKNGTWFTYAHDLTKNVTELYNTAGGIATSYDYTPYGAVTAIGADQPFQWSSEVHDAELGMVYYNYRHYNPMDGRWINRDPIDEQGGWNLYEFVENKPLWKGDLLGLIRLTPKNVAECLIAEVVVDKPSMFKIGLGKKVILTPGTRRNLKPYHHTYAVVRWKKGDGDKNKCCDKISAQYTRENLNWVQLTLLIVNPSGSDSEKPDNELSLQGWIRNNLTKKTMLGKYHKLEEQPATGGNVHDRGYGSTPIPITFNYPPSGYRFIIDVKGVEIYRAEHYFNNEKK